MSTDEQDRQEDQDREDIAKATRDRRLTAILTGCAALILGVIDVMVRWDLASAHMSTDWVDLLDVLTMTTALAAVVIASSDWSRLDRVAMVARRARMERQLHAELRDHMAQWMAAARTEIMSAFGEILAKLHLIVQRQKGLAEAMGRALAEMSMHLGTSLADLGRRLAGQIAEGQQELADSQRALAERLDTTDDTLRQLLVRVDQMFAAVDRLAGQVDGLAADRQEARQMMGGMCKRLDQIESGVVDMAAAFEAGQRYGEATSSVSPASVVEPRPRLVAGEN